MTHQKLLEWLHIYTYLTISQCMRLGYTKSTKTLRKDLKLLIEKWMIRKTSYKYSPSQWKFEDVYFLQPHGRRYLEERCWIVSMKKPHEYRHKPFYEDYVHRMMTIHSHITIREYLSTKNKTIECIDFYFERKKSPHTNRYETATKVSVWNGYIIPDAIFWVQINWVPRLYCVELHRWYRVKKIEKQLKQYAYALAQGSISDKYDIQSNAYIIVVFEKEQTMQTVQERFDQDNFFMYVRQYFHFVSYDVCHE